jgi:imidazolonepropionase-like amidohydrolase
MNTLPSLFLVCACTLSCAATAQTFAIKVGHLVDPERSLVTDGRVLLIEAGKIVDVLDRMPSPAPERVIDLSASWVVPGLMDLHTHVSYDYTNHLCANFAEHGNGFRSLMGLRNAQELLNAGFTTLREVGNAGDYVDTDLRRAIEQGLFRGPTIINAGKIIAPFGGQQDFAAPEAGTCWDYEYIDADGVDEVRKAVRKNIFYGARTLKMVSDFRRGTHGIYTEEEIRVAAEEAHRAGIILTVHANEDATARPAVLAGADSIEHGYELSDTVLKLMKERGTYLVPTDLPLSHILRLAGADTRKRYDQKQSRMRRAYEIGVPMAFGTDTTHDLEGRDRGQMGLDFFDAWLEAGVPHSYILKALTSNAAKLLKIDGQRGSLAKGRYADLLAVPGNPLQDINVLKRSTFVMKNGEVVRQ